MLKNINVHQKDVGYRERLIDEFAPAIRYMAARMSFRLPPSLDIDDLIHAGVMGLMDAIGKFDPSKETQFKTYAEYRIRGAMLDEIRSMDWIPRSVREKMSLIEKTCQLLTKQLGRAPSADEIARALQMDRDQYNGLLFQAKAVSLIGFDDLGIKDEGNRRILESLADLRAENALLSLLTKDMRERLVEAIENLPQREGYVLSLYYYEEMTMKEIGLVLGITESRICQLHAQAIIRLKANLNGGMQEKNGVDHHESQQE